MLKLKEITINCNYLISKSKSFNLLGARGKIICHCWLICGGKKQKDSCLLSTFFKIFFFNGFSS